MPWDDVEYRVEEIQGHAISACLDALSRIYVNGGVVLRSFQAIVPAEFERAMRADFRGTDQMLKTVLTRSSIVDELPELRITVPLDRPPEFRWQSAFGMEGELTHMLLTGGAYEKFRGTVNEARCITREFMETIFGTDLHSLWTSSSATPWTTWFFDIAWDTTFVVWDSNRHRFVLMCCTDTD